MIATIKHKGLKRFFEAGDTKGIQAEHAERIANILGILSVAEDLDDIDLPSLRLHPLKGKLKGLHSVTVRANWRIVFSFENGNCMDLDFLDYH